jgi:hypothetical protein
LVDVVVGLGGRFELGVGSGYTYAIQGLTQDSGYDGFTVQLLTRMQVVDAPGFKLAWRIDPGFFVSYDINGSHDKFLFLQLGLALEAGFPIHEAVSVNASLSVPAWVGGSGEGIAIGIPILLGVGLEVHPSRHVALTLTVKAGPTVAAATSGSEFTLYALGGVAFAF